MAQTRPQSTQHWEQKACIQRIEQMQEQSFKPSNKTWPESASRRLGKTVIDVSICSKLGERCLINDFTYSFSPEDRVGFIGPNGMGKSTLLDLSRPPTTRCWFGGARRNCGDRPL